MSLTSIYCSFSIIDDGELTDVFVTLGSNDLIDSSRADLTGIINANNNTKTRLSLEHFVYKTRIDVTGISYSLTDGPKGNHTPQIAKRAQ